MGNSLSVSVGPVGTHSDTRGRVRQTTAIWLTVSVLSLYALQALAADNIFNDASGKAFMEETVSTSESEKVGWPILYSIYSSIYHGRYNLADQWIIYGIRKGATTELAKAQDDSTYLSKALNSVAATRKEAAVKESSVDLVVVRALLQSILGQRDESLDMLKRAVSEQVAAIIKWVR